MGPRVFGEVREAGKEVLGQGIWTLGLFGSPGRLEFCALVFLKRCEELGLGSRAFGEAIELGARNLGGGEEVLGEREFHVQVLEPEGEFRGEV